MLCQYSGPGPHWRRQGRPPPLHAWSLPCSQPCARRRRVRRVREHHHICNAHNNCIRDPTDVTRYRIRG
eukprot:5902265-Pleurochrysis_carterae.AAC.1